MPFLQSIQKSGYGMFSSSVNPYLTLTYVNTVDGITTNTLTHPGGVQVGDVCVLMIYGYDNDSEDILSTFIPTGFTSLVTTPTTAATQTSLNISFRVLTSTAAVTMTTAGMDNYAWIAMYYRISNGTLASTQTYPGTSNSVATNTLISSTVPEITANTAALYIGASASYNDEALLYPVGPGVNNGSGSITAYGNASPLFGSLLVGVTYGPEASAIIEAEPININSINMSVASARIGFTKSGV